MGKKNVTMSNVSLTRLKDFWSKERFTLLLIFIAAAIIRSIPGWMHAAWGNDYGIYYGITKDFAENPELFQPYTGWGDSYNFFPVLYVTITFLHYITGAEIGWLLPRVIPIFGGLAVLVFYFVSKEIVQDKTLALLCCAFLATNPFHIFQTSHAAPMTMGHFSMALCLYFFVKRERTSVSLGALYICSILLVASHHLTTFFYIITIVFITFYRNFISEKWTQDIKGDIFYIISFTGFTFLYWMIIATPVYRSFIRGGLKIPSWSVVIIFYLGILILFLFVILRRRFIGFSKREKNKLPSLYQLILITVIAASVFVITFSLIEIPRTGFKFEGTALFFLLPLFISVGFGVYGGFVLTSERQRGYVLGWLYPISISLVITTITWHQGLFPYRHLEYIAYPFSILSAIGAYSYWIMLKEKENAGEMKETEKLKEDMEYDLKDEETEADKDDGFKDEDHNKKKQLLTSKVFSYFVLIVLILNLISAYSVQEVTSRYDESISQEVFDVTYWMKGNVTGYNFTIASDHRISQIFWAEGYNVTSDLAYQIWFTENWTESLMELETANGTKPRIEYIVIDHVMRYNGVQSNINETPRNLTDKSYEKFMLPPFTLIYRSENKDGSKWAELYQVDWDYIELNR